MQLSASMLSPASLASGARACARSQVRHSSFHIPATRPDRGRSCSSRLGNLVSSRQPGRHLCWWRGNSFAAAACRCPDPRLSVAHSLLQVCNDKLATSQARACHRPGALYASQKPITWLSFVLRDLPVSSTSCNCYCSSLRIAHTLPLFCR